MESASDPTADARAIIDANLYMVLATADERGARGRRWRLLRATGISRALLGLASGARHSRNLQARPQLGIVIFDSSVPIGTGRGVYISAVAERCHGRRRNRDRRLLSAVAGARRQRVDTGARSGAGDTAPLPRDGREIDVLGEGDQRVRVSLRRQALVRSRSWSSSWAASSTSLCRHSAARYTQAISPDRWTRRVPVDEGIPRFRLVGRAFGQAEVPLGVVRPGMRGEERVSDLGVGLRLSPFAPEHVLATADQPPRAAATARSFSAYEATAGSSRLPDADRSRRPPACAVHPHGPRHALERARPEVVEHDIVGAAAQQAPSPTSTSEGAARDAIRAAMITVSP